MDLLDEYIESQRLDSDKVLSLVDEWTLYYYYLSEVYGEDYDIKLGKKIRSPLPYRVDNNPSFVIFPSNNSYFEYLWKDNALNLSGGIFKLIKELARLNTFDEVYQLINKDFELGIGTTNQVDVKITKKDKPDPIIESNIRIKSRDYSKEAIEFWKMIGVDIFSVRHKMREVEYYWMNDLQEYPYRASTLTFAYYEWSMLEKRYKIQLYSPYAEKQFKFASDYDDSVVLGFYDLKYESDLLLINKSKKDIILLDSMGYESISGRSETTIIPRMYIDYLKTKYKRIVVMQDPDPAGWSGAYKYKSMYGLECITIYPCLLTGCKDVSDYSKRYGVDSTKQLMKMLL